MALLVAKDSPLRLRADLDRMQAQQFHAIAVSANVIDVMYRRLVNDLEHYDPQQGADPLLADVYGIIDWVFRMDGLVERCRGLRKDLGCVVEYRQMSRLVETSRHQAQHLENTIPLVEPSGRSPWGHLAWTELVSDTRFDRVVLLTAVIDAPKPRWKVQPNVPPRTRIDHVNLYTADGEAHIGLTGQHEALVRFIPKLEQAVRDAGSPGNDRILRVGRRVPRRSE